MMIDRDIVRFCSIECKLQMSGELSVGWMVDAWLYAQACSTEWDFDSDPPAARFNLPTLEDVINLGRLVEPNVNVWTDKSEFRTVDVRVGWDIKMPWQDVPAAMVDLMEDLALSRLMEAKEAPLPDSMTPEVFFKTYEDIHPWRDGNGRTGVILYNWLKGTLDNPVWAPNFWDDPRRTVGFGA